MVSKASLPRLMARILTMIALCCVDRTTVRTCEGLCLTISSQNLAHAQGSKPIRKGIDTGSRIARGVCVWPDNVEARVDMGNDKVMEGRMR
jgi:hypothetical protein